MCDSAGCSGYFGLNRIVLLIFSVCLYRYLIHFGILEDIIERSSASISRKVQEKIFVAFTLWLPCGDKRLFGIDMLLRSLDRLFEYGLCVLSLDSQYAYHSLPC